MNVSGKPSRVGLSKSMGKLASTYSALHPKDPKITSSKQNLKTDYGTAEHPFNSPKPVSSRTFPQDPPPKSLILPYYPPGIRRKGFGRIIESEKPRTIHDKDARSHSNQETISVPSWLIQLEETQLNALMDIKDLLHNEEDDEKLLDSLYDIITNRLNVSVTKEEICQVLASTPMDLVRGAGLHFSHFIYMMGSKQPINLLTPVQVRGRTRVNCAKACKDSEKENTEEDAAINRQRVFYSGLLILEMYETLQRVEGLYFNDWMPPPSNQSNINSNKFNTIGFKKLGTSAWDAPLRPLPKLSPYLQPVAFVMNRFVIQKPNHEERYQRKRTLQQIQPMHLMIEPPRAVGHGFEPIRITENRQRIRDTLKYLSEQGNYVALLPNIEFLIHLSDTFVDKLEKINMRAAHTIAKRKVYHHNDLLWVAREIKTLYAPQGLPGSIIQIPQLIKYTDALELRGICKRIQDDQWANISERKVAFEKMRVDHIPEGILRNGFLQTFECYLPYISHLPVVPRHTNIVQSRHPI